MENTLEVATSLRVTEVAELVEPLGEAIRSVAETVGAAITKLMEAIREMFGEALGKMVKRIIEPLGEAIRSVAETVGAAVTKLMEAIREGFGEALGEMVKRIMEPLTVIEPLRELMTAEEIGKALEIIAMTYGVKIQEEATRFSAEEIIKPELESVEIRRTLRGIGRKISEISKRWFKLLRSKEKEERLLGFLVEALISTQDGIPLSEEILGDLDHIKSEIHDKNLWRRFCKQIKYVEYIINTIISIYKISKEQKRIYVHLRSQEVIGELLMFEESRTTGKPPLYYQYAHYQMYWDTMLCFTKNHSFIAF